MPIISNYPFDKNVQDNDAWIGTDASNMSTKQFTALDVAKYLNIKGKISICLLYTSPSPRDVEESRMPSSA